MPLVEHLREFRSRLIKVALAVVIGAILGWFLYDPVYSLLRSPIDDYIAAHPDRKEDIKVTLEGITTAFSLQLTVSIFVGIVLSSPIWMYQTWAFILPGLTKKERRVSLAFIAAGVPLFIAGVALARVSMPIVVGVLLDFTPTGAANFPSLSDYMSFVIRFALGFGLAFLLPVLLVALNRAGVMPASALRRAWRPAVLGIFVFSAMMMPTPDPYALFLLAAPLTVLYFAAVGLTSLFDRRKERARPGWLDLDDAAPSAVEPANTL